MTRDNETGGAGHRPFAMPQKALGREQHVGVTLMNKLVRTGEVDSFIFAERFRYIVMSSWHDYVARCQAGGVPRDPVAQQAAVDAYNQSKARHAGADAAAKARAGWKPNHGKEKPKPRRDGTARAATAKAAATAQGATARDNVTV
jgi:hypothetical protein